MVTWSGPKMSSSAMRPPSATAICTRAGAAGVSSRNSLAAVSRRPYLLCTLSSCTAGG